ncbi:hypothetical protein A1359_03655 [Methylomonas lenta]|uniref:TonB-dependent receptor-like beta-barrel domain-containing protein n=1 Tax=Methylomonas lenta TaxID=980561 RepID=A0A177NPW9_9GAMM|nr:TonB-dependent receptor [Methylomonas lenta]OAI20116.1 hypothetical protein A1359_03655 [Methylomonas lenta]
MLINLKEETAYNLDVGYRFKTDWLRAEFDLFHNRANDYIYQQRDGEFVNGSDVPRMPPLRYGFQLDYNWDKLSNICV